MQVSRLLFDVVCVEVVYICAKYGQKQVEFLQTLGFVICILKNHIQKRKEQSLKLFMKESDPCMVAKVFLGKLYRKQSSFVICLQCPT